VLKYIKKLFLRSAHQNNANIKKIIFLAKKKIFGNAVQNRVPKQSVNDAISQKNKNHKS
jgi:hypothetical protein